MTDDTPRKRSWFQIHLSTAVVLMVVAGVLVWANVRVTLDPTWRKGNQYERGWPIRLYESYPTMLVAELFPPDPGTWYWGWFIFDVSIALAILTAVSVGCEWFIRRREKAVKQGRQ